MASLFLNRAFRPSVNHSEEFSFVCKSCRQHKSTFARQRKALRVKPDPSFEPSKTAKSDHIIFNPPSSAPSVYHTPAKFLPESDPRSKRHSTTLSSRPFFPSIRATSNPSDPLSRTSKLPPPVKTPYEKKYHLGPEQVEEIRKLRAEDPRKWTRLRLAAKFECSEFFVSLCCCAPEVKAEQDRRLKQIKERWGRKKTEAREERQARKALWGRDA